VVGRPCGGEKWTKRAYTTAFSLSFGTAGVKTVFDKVPDKAKKGVPIAGIFGVPTSVNKVVDWYGESCLSATCGADHHMVHSLTSTTGTTVIKLAKHPSGDDGQVGPTSVQDLFRASKWKELWEGKELPTE
jgi:hypothetical protein